MPIPVRSPNYLVDGGRLADITARDPGVGTDPPPTTDTQSGVIVLNPVSGGGEHEEVISKRAALHGYEVRTTKQQGDAITLAREAAANGASRIVAAGGDGTLNEVLRGVDRAGAFDRVTIGVIPSGTGNNFAENIGITTIEEGFRALDHGEVHRIDLGRADDRVFVNSCVGGLTADASADTSPEMKSKFGVLAYVMTTLRNAGSFEGLRCTVSTGGSGGGGSEWTGEAACVLIGNGRKFPTGGETQANMTDGLFDVTIIEDVPAVDLLGNAFVHRFLDADAPHTTRLQLPHLEIRPLEPRTVDFSLDGEMIQAQTLTLDVEPRTVRLVGGERFDPAG